MKNRFFSIVVINLNNGHYLENCLHSLLDQTYNFYEIVLIDSGSTDNSLEILDKFNSNHRLRILYNNNPNSNLNIIQARSKGIMSSFGDFICFADSDCIYPRNWISDIYKQFNFENNIAIVFGPRYPDIGKGFGTQIRRLEGYQSRKYRSNENITFKSLDQGFYYLAGCNMAIERDALLRIKGFDTQFNQTSFEDVDLEIKILKAGYKIRFCSSICITHNHPLSLRGLIIKAKKSGKGYAKIIRKHPEQLSSKWSPINDICLWLLYLLISWSIFGFTSFFLFFSFALFLIDAYRRLFSVTGVKKDPIGFLTLAVFKFIHDLARSIGFIYQFTNEFLAQGKKYSTNLPLQIQNKGRG